LQNEVKRLSPLMDKLTADYKKKLEKNAEIKIGDKVKFTDPNYFYGAGLEGVVSRVFISEELSLVCRVTTAAGTDHTIPAWRVREVGKNVCEPERPKKKRKKVKRKLKKKR